MIRMRGSKYVVTPKSGTRVLGTHRTKKGARRQLAAIEIAKKRRRK